MLWSMTGFGEARHESQRLSLSFEVRAVNNRYLKVSVRAPDPYHLLEGEIEKVVRKLVKRGTLQIQLRCDKPPTLDDFRINSVALASYVKQIRQVAADLDLADGGQALLAQVLSLPGVVPEAGAAGHAIYDDWPLLEKTLEHALANLNRMRQEEGQAMALELIELRLAIVRRLETIRQRVPHVVASFRDRLFERVKGLLKELDVKLDQNDLIRETSLYAERSDIAEEIVRLGTHLDHFQEIVQKDNDSPGRKLEFVTQEMGREANTIGSKASDVVISREVVEIKGTLEKIRELIQNVE